MNNEYIWVKMEQQVDFSEERVDWQDKNVIFF